MKQKIGIYLHWPFCESKCPYCDFSTYVPKEPIQHDRWLRSYIKQLEHFFRQINTEKYELESIFFGGGTPSLMKATTVQEIISFCKTNITPAKDIEITIESNPSSVEAEKFAQFKAAGINRVSIGVQSLNNNSLRWLGRRHSAEEAISAINAARKTFDNYSIDIIYGLKGQSNESWATELLEITKVAGKHLSMYSLTVEDKTKFGQLHKTNLLPIPPEHTTEEMFFTTNKVLTSRGFKRYEISNYAIDGMESKHNMLYWNCNDFIGVGPSAAGRFFQKNGSRIATKNMCNHIKWLEEIETTMQPNITDAQRQQIIERVYETEPLDEQTQLQEILMMGMRVAKGINTEDILRRLNIQIITPQMESKIKTLQEHGLLILENNILMPTEEGMNRANSISRFLF